MLLPATFGDLAWGNSGVLGQKPLVAGAQSHCHLLGGFRALGHPGLGYQAQENSLVPIGAVITLIKMAFLLKLYKLRGKFALKKHIHIFRVNVWVSV